MNGVNAQLQRHRREQRRENVERGGGIQEAPGDQQDDVDDDEEDDRAAAGDIHHKALNGQIQPGAGEHIAEQRSAHGDEHDGGCGAAGVNEDVLDFLQVDLPIDEDTHDQPVEHGDGGSLGGGEDAAIDTAEDDDGHQKTPECILERYPALLAGGLGKHLQIHLPADDQCGDDQAHAHQQTGDHAGLEEVGDGGVRNRAVHDKGDGRRDHHADGAACRHQSAGEGGGISGLHKGGDHDQTQGRHRGGAGAGDRCEEAGNHHADHGHTAADVAEALLCQIDKTTGNACLFHHIAGENEEGDRQQNKFTAGRGAQTGQHAHNGVQRLTCALRQNSAYAGHTQTHGDGCAEHQQYHKDTQ